MTDAGDYMFHFMAILDGRVRVGTYAISKYNGITEAEARTEAKLAIATRYPGAVLKPPCRDCAMGWCDDR